jgi:hypothetical protein
MQTPATTLFDAIAVASPVITMRDSAAIKAKVERIIEDGAAHLHVISGPSPPPRRPSWRRFRHDNDKVLGEWEAQHFVPWAL